MTVDTEQGVAEQYEGPHDLAQDALNAAAEKADMTEPHTREHREAERFRQGVEIEAEMQASDTVIESLKVKLKREREAHDVLVLKMRRLFSEPDQMPLFDETEEYVLAWQGSDDPRAKQALMDIPQLEAVLTSKLLENLNEAGVMTLGDLIDGQKEPGGLKNIGGIGQSRADKIEQAVSDYIMSLTPGGQPGDTASDENRQNPAPDGDSEKPGDTSADNQEPAEEPEESFV